jgi:hypothetical protein
MREPLRHRRIHLNHEIYCAEVSTMSETTGDVHRKFEPRPDAAKLTGHSDELPHGVSKGVDYEPHPEKSISLSAEHESVKRRILNLYSGSASKDDMEGIFVL